MTNLLNERFEDITNMLLHCRIKVEDKEDPNILDILSDIRSMPGVATVKQTRPLSDKKTTSGKRIIEVNVSYNPKYIDDKNPNPTPSDGMMKLLKLIIKVESLDRIKVVDHDDLGIKSRLNKNPIII